MYVLLASIYLGLRTQKAAEAVADEVPEWLSISNVLWRQHIGRVRRLLHMGHKGGLRGGFGGRGSGSPPGFG